MKRSVLSLGAGAVALAALTVLPHMSHAAGPSEPDAARVPDITELKRLTAQFAPVDIKVDLAALDVNERRALSRLVAAARIMDGLFLRQVWAGNTSLLLSLAADTSPLAQARLRFFMLQKGPWDRVDKNRAFLPGVPAKPEQGAFYPDDANRREVEAWIAQLPEPDRTRARGFFTVVRRSPPPVKTAAPGGPFMLVPYSVEYQGELIAAAALLNEAAAATQQPTLKRYLEKRARALMTDDYYDSDVAWLELDASIEPTIGPYEVYEDEWFNAKAAFEAFITLRDDAETQKLSQLSGTLQDIEDHLPIEPSFRNPKIGALAPIRVVNVIFTAGDANRGVQTAAFNLPNDERVIKEKGSKRVMLKNIQQAKFDRVLVPISKIALAPADQKRVSFDAFFTHILMHELVHGLGPHNVATSDGRTATVRERLKETYSAIEEAKADITGLWSLAYLIDKKSLPSSLGDSMYVTYLASAFRSVRFGITEAHGKGIAIQMNTLIDQGAFKIGSDGRFSVDPAKMKTAVEALSRELMMIQAKGDYAAAQELIAKRAVLRPEVSALLAKLAKIPIDIAPRFVTADGL